MTVPPGTVPPGTAPVRVAEEEYFDALTRADEVRAVGVAVDLLTAGTSGEEVLLRLVAPAQVQVGRLWQTGAWSIAQEHAATCIAERVVFAVGVRTRSRGGRDHIVLGCLDGEWHALAARIVGEVLRMHDWRVTFLGASVPSPYLVSFLHHHGPDAVALSAATPLHLPAAHRMIVAAQRTGTPVLVGGPGFGAAGRWARRLRADTWAPTAAAALELLAQRSSWPTPETSSHSVPDAVSGSEYADLRRRRGHLVVAGTERLRAGGPAGPVASDTGLSDSPVDDDLGTAADLLAVAAYLGDRQVFTDHVGWPADVAVHRVVVGTVLRAVLDAFAAELPDLPFARGCLADGVARLSRRTVP